MTNEPDLRQRLAERVKYVIVDEYQDVNPIQEAIVWLLYDLGAHICVVGDDDQTIYQWRGSEVENILTFAKRYPAVDQITLAENFQSSDGIVDTARAFIEQNAVRLPKAMKPAGTQDFEAGDIVALIRDPRRRSTAYRQYGKSSSRCCDPSGRNRAGHLLVGYGRRSDYVEVYELDERKRKPRSVDDEFIADVKTQVRSAADALRAGVLPAKPSERKCKSCDYVGMCNHGAGLARAMR
jgi:hypothetical protein